MYRQAVYHETSITANESTEGETIEMKMERVMTNNEPITDGAPVTYTERSEGVLPEYNIRTDKWEVALQGMEQVAQGHRDKRQTSIEERKKALDEMGDKKDAKGEPTRDSSQSTDN